eukprot:scaffold250988_cov24-Tisochrysis_lutea.AAC.2
MRINKFRKQQSCVFVNCASEKVISSAWCRETGQQTNKPTCSNSLFDARAHTLDIGRSLTLFIPLAFQLLYATVGGANGRGGGEW